MPRLKRNEYSRVTDADVDLRGVICDAANGDYGLDHTSSKAGNVQTTIAVVASLLMLLPMVFHLLGVVEIRYTQLLAIVPRG